MLFILGLKVIKFQILQQMIARIGFGAAVMPSKEESLPFRAYCIFTESRSFQRIIFVIQWAGGY